MIRRAGGDAQSVDFSRRKASKAGLFSKARVSWNKKVLFAEPPPLAIIKKRYSSPLSAAKSIWAGRFVPLFFSVKVSVATFCDSRKFSVAYAFLTPSDRACASVPSVKTVLPFSPKISAVPVSWHNGRTPAEAMHAFFKNSKAANRSFGAASGASNTARICRK